MLSSVSLRSSSVATPQLGGGKNQAEIKKKYTGSEMISWEINCQNSRKIVMTEGYVIERKKGSKKPFIASKSFTLPFASSFVWLNI